MIALLFSALIAIYLLIPNTLFRYVLGRSVPVRNFQGPKTEELTQAVVTLAFIFGIALLAVWYIPPIKNWPFSFVDSPSLRSNDYKVVASGLYSETMFKDYGDRFWDSFWRVVDRQARFASWYYLLCFLIAYALGQATKRYGKLKQWRAYSKFADIYLIPHISQWHVILSPFTFPDPKTVVKADVLMSDDTLYRGEVAQHFVDKDGNLSGLFLRDPQRFDRGRYLKDRDSWGTTRPVSTYWRPIPSAKLYLVGSQIINLNLNYEPPSVSDVSVAAIEKYLERNQKRPLSVTISPRPRPHIYKWIIDPERISRTKKTNQ